MEISGTAQHDAWQARALPLVEQLRADVWSIPVPIPHNPLRYVSVYAFALDGTPQVLDPSQVLGGTVGTSQDWQLAMWWGGYDVDTLCGYVRGTLSVPFVEHPGTPRA